jgi:hypothetical protein
VRETGCSIWARIGRRGTTLLFLALVDFVYAASLAFPQPEALRSPTVRYIADIAPLWVWGGAWAAVGAVCLAGAFARRDRWAFAAAMGIKVLWGTTYLLGWALVGLSRGWVSAVVWLGFAAFVGVVSSWPEVPVAVPVAKGNR